jgi:hypothetical protein
MNKLVNQQSTKKNGETVGTLQQANFFFVYHFQFQTLVSSVLDLIVRRRRSLQTVAGVFLPPFKDVTSCVQCAIFPSCVVMSASERKVVRLTHHRYKRLHYSDKSAVAWSSIRLGYITQLQNTSNFPTNFMYRDRNIRENDLCLINPWKLLMYPLIKRRKHRLVLWQANRSGYAAIYMAWTGHFQGYIFPSLPCCLSRMPVVLVSLQAHLCALLITRVIFLSPSPISSLSKYVSV